MEVRETGFEGLLEIIPTIFEDERGWFYEFFNEATLKQHGIHYNFVQDNRSFSHKGVIRGLHFQREPHGQAKLVTVLTGRIVDVVVDVRPGSLTFGKVYYCELDAVKRNMLMVPEGFAHGIAALEDTMILYKCSAFYNKPFDTGLIWNDPALNIQWPFKNPIVSQKDNALPTFTELFGKSVI